MAERVLERMSDRFVEVRVIAGNGDGKLMAFMRGHTHVLDETASDDHLAFAALVDRQLLGQLRAMSRSIEVRE